MYDFSYMVSTFFCRLQHSILIWFKANPLIRSTFVEPNCWHSQPIFQNRQTGSRLILLSNSASFASPSSLLLSVSGWPQSHPSWETPLLNWSFVVAGISYPDVENKTLHSLIAVHNFDFIEKLFLVFRLADLVLLFLVLSAVNFFFSESAPEKSLMPTRR